jgi:hypothetical protein
MIYAAKTVAATTIEESLQVVQTEKNQVFFHAATFGYSKSDPKHSQGEVRRPSCARVRTRGISISRLSPSTGGSMSKTKTFPSYSCPPKIGNGDPELRKDLGMQPPVIMFNDTFEEVGTPRCQKLNESSRGHSIHSGITTPSPNTSNESVRTGTHYRQGCDISPMDISIDPAKVWEKEEGEHI